MAAVAIGLEGCASPAMKKEKAKTALQEKYKEDFQIVCYTEAKLFSDYYTVLAYAEEYPDLIFRASVDNKSGMVSDTYVTKRLCDRISDRISENIAALKTEYYVFTEAMFGGTSITNPNVSFDEYMEDGPGNEFTVHLCLGSDGADAQNITESFADMLNGFPEICGVVCIYLTDDPMMSEIREYTVSHDATYSDFEDMTESVYLGAVEFENGSFYMTEGTLREMAGDRL